MKMRKPPLREQVKMHVFSKTLSGHPLIRVKHRPERKLGEGKGVKNACYALRCGCCSQKLEIYYDESSLEINGVDGSIQNWREILLPLLGINPKDVPTKEQVEAKHTLEKLRKKYAHPSSL